MNRRMIIISLLFVAAILMSGCVEEGSIVVNYNTTGLSVDSSNNVTVTEITKGSRGPGVIEQTITGRVVEIRFRSKDDIIVFEDGCVVAARSAEKFTWRIGEVTKIVIRKCSLLDETGNIISIENVEVTDK